MKFLIIKTSALGDILHVFPVIDYLKKKFPNCQIDWVVEKQNQDLVKSHPAINQAFCISTKAWRKGKELSAFFSFRKRLQQTCYDCVFDLQGNMKSGLVTFLAKSKNKVGFGYQTAPEFPNTLFTHTRFNPPFGASVREDYLYLVQSFFNDTEKFSHSGTRLHLNEEQSQTALFWQNHLQALQKPIILVCPGSAWKNKQLTEETLIEFLQKVQDHTACYFMVLWGNEGEKQQALRIKEGMGKDTELLDKLQLPVLQNVMTHVRLVITMDSLPLHLAGSAMVPTFSVFGPSLASKYKPSGSLHVAYQGKCPYGKTFDKRCPILRTCETGACMRELTSVELFNEFKASEAKNSIF